MTKRKPKEPPQIDKFRQLAQDLECDNDEEPFAERVKRIATAPKPPPKAANGK